MPELPEDPANEPARGTEIEDEIQDLSQRLETSESPREGRPSARPERRSRPLDSPWLAAVLVLVAAALTAANLAEIGPFDGPTARVDLGSDRNMLERTLLFAVEEIEAYRAAHDGLPRQLEDVNLSEDLGLSYTVLGRSHYTVIARDEDRSETYDSNTDPAARFGELWSGPAKEAHDD